MLDRPIAHKPRLEKLFGRESIFELEAPEIIGVRALLVHALHERAREFNLQYDFEPAPTDQMHLILLMKDARKVV